MVDAPPFRDLLQQLAASYDRILASNVRLQAEVLSLSERLRNRETQILPREQEHSPGTPTSSGSFVEDISRQEQEMILEFNATVRHKRPTVEFDCKASSSSQPIVSSDDQGRLEEDDCRKRSPAGSAAFLRQISDPDGYALWPIWREDRNVDSLKRFKRRSATQTLLTEETSSFRGGDKLMDPNSCLQPLVSGPNSRRRVAWDLVSVFVVGYDVLTVPLLAFSPMDTPVWEALGMCTTIFWTVDIPLAFLSGYHSEGVIEMRPGRIARAYMRHWFGLDAFIILVDWALFFVQSGLTDILGLVRGPKMLRLLRLFRVLRLLRVLKLPGLLDELVAYFDSETLQTAINISKSLVVLGVVNHFIACAWYGITLIPNECGRTWVAELDEDRNTPYVYTSALHWSLTQFTPASMEIVPRNTIERIFTIVVLMGAMVTFSTFVSGITSSMTTLRMHQAEKQKQKTNLRRYISENQISIGLASKMVAFFPQGLTRTRRLHEEDIPVLQMLPDLLRMQLHWEVYSKNVTRHPLFNHVNQADEMVMVEICHKCLSEKSVPSQQDVFSLDDKATNAYVVVFGTLRFSVDPKVGHLCEVREGDWISEVVLWLEWTHLGFLNATMHSELVVFNAKSFHKVVSMLPTLYWAFREYARLYRERIICDSLMWDVWYNDEVCRELVRTSFESVATVMGPSQRFPLAQAAVASPGRHRLNEGFSL